MAGTTATPSGTPLHPALPPLRRFQIVDKDGFPTTMFLQYLQQQFSSGPTIASEAFAEAVLSIPPWSWLDAP